MTVSIMSKDYLTRKFLLFKLIGETSIKNSIPFFQKVVISRHVSCPHAHQQNGSAERKHRHIVEVGLSLLAYASMPLKFWDEAFPRRFTLSTAFPARLLLLKLPLSVFF
jgi:histone deacetylase 1/2